MGTFGERMQREREMRDISLEEIAESTKISCRMLRALEEEDFKRLPGGIFNKGFVRAYSKFLGIDEEQAVSDFMTAFQESLNKNGGADPTANSFPNSEVISSLDARSDQTVSPGSDQAAGFLRAAVVLVLLLGIGGFAWKYFSNRTVAVDAQGTKPVTLAPTQAQKPIQVPAKADPIQGAAGDPSQAGDPDSNANSKKTEEPAKQADKQPIAVEQPSPIPPTKEARYEPPDAVSTGGLNEPFRLQILAREQSWVEVTADGKRLLNMTLTAGSEKSFRASKEIVVKLGNAPGVEISHNGKQMPLLPSDSKTRTLTFTPEGMRQ